MCKFLFLNYDLFCIWPIASFFIRCGVTHSMHAKSTIHKIDPITKTESRTKKLMYLKIISRAMRIFPENLTTFEQKKFQKNLEEIFALTLIREARVLDPKECGVQGCNPGGGCGGPNRPPIFFFSRMVNFMDNFFFQKCSNLFQFISKMRNVLKRI